MQYYTMIKRTRMKDSLSRWKISIFSLSLMALVITTSAPVPNTVERML